MAQEPPGGRGRGGLPSSPSSVAVRGPTSAAARAAALRKIAAITSSTTTTIAAAFFSSLTVYNIAISRQQFFLPLNNLQVLRIVLRRKRQLAVSTSIESAPYLPEKHKGFFFLTTCRARRPTIYRFYNKNQDLLSSCFPGARDDEQDSFQCKRSMWRGFHSCKARNVRASFTTYIA